jgi:hypothetical protein
MLRLVHPLVAAAEERLEPLTLARNTAWWDMNVEASEENAKRRAETELAYSDALADRELFAEVGRARGARSRASGSMSSRSSAAATSIHVPGRTSTRSASTSTAPGTCACSRT